MTGYALTDFAVQDIAELWAFIAQDNFDAAEKLEAEIFEACNRIAARPDLGHFRRDLTARPLRFFPVRGLCLIVYEAETNPIQVIRILHGARDAFAELD